MNAPMQNCASKALLTVRKRIARRLVEKIKAMSSSTAMPSTSRAISAMSLVLHMKVALMLNETAAGEKCLKRESVRFGKEHDSAFLRRKAEAKITFEPLSIGVVQFEGRANETGHYCMVVPHAHPHAQRQYFRRHQTPFLSGHDPASVAQTAV